MLPNMEEMVLVSFTLGDELYGIDIRQIREVIRLCEIIHVPNTPPLVEGIINLRGSVVCILDLHKRFNLPPSELPPERIMIVDIIDRLMGLMVDKVCEVIRVPLDNLEPVPPEMDTAHTRFLMAVGKLENRMILILDCQKMLSVEELLKLDQVE